ncbi:MAG: glutamine synthetase III [Bacteroidota bacterium]|nr:glutamine synthetase III [Bacteroidota bacterium]
MNSLRQKALEKIIDRKPNKKDFPTEKVSDYFGCNVFDYETMQSYMPKHAFEHIQEAIVSGKRINRNIADQIASGMKSWAEERGATHYTHWFHPLTGETAEKHDAFLDTNHKGQAFEGFSGKLLSQQEPDASSFPHGGLRNTFEARGYTAWDPSSPAFVLDKTLCIPTIFIAYTGEALDYKTPLLKALHELDKCATETMQYFDRKVTQVFATLGWEQEYFLIDRALFLARPDLVLTGRTLLGHSSAKDQQLNDHYFGAIPERVVAFMKDFEYEAHKLGIPVKTRHNEVAPNQFECAPIFEEANLANDHNLLLMEVMRRVSLDHNFKVLFHEKPYKGVNGSGKHNNWSMQTDNGENLLQPGNTPKQNLRFLTFLVNITKAVSNYGDILRASIVSAGNLHRLGASEAPPSIISVFLGDRLTEILDELEKQIPDSKMSPDLKTKLKLDIGKIPELLLDNTDRNRTSPFAFTGNRFEFRAVGSAANSAGPITVLTAAVAQQLKEFNTETNAVIKSKKLKKDEAIFHILRRYIKESKSVRFEGNGYSNEWEKEAEKRGLSNIKSASEAYKSYVDKHTIKLFTESNILTQKELESRYEIKTEEYNKKIQIESRVLGDLAINHINPTAIKYQNILIQNLQGLKAIYSTDEEFRANSENSLETLNKLNNHRNAIIKNVKDMINSRKEAKILTNCKERLVIYETKVLPYMTEIRYHIDKLELIIDDELWSLPKYREMLFTR